MSKRLLSCRPCTPYIHEEQYFQHHGITDADNDSKTFSSGTMAHDLICIKRVWSLQASDHHNKEGQNLDFS